MIGATQMVERQKLSDPLFFCEGHSLATINGSPCNRCKGTLRYKANRTCVKCHKIAVKGNQKRKKRANGKKMKYTKRGLEA